MDSILCPSWIRAHEKEARRQKRHASIASSMYETRGAYLGLLRFQGIDMSDDVAHRLQAFRLAKVDAFLVL